MTKSHPLRPTRTGFRATISARFPGITALNDSRGLRVAIRREQVHDLMAYAGSVGLQWKDLVTVEDRAIVRIFGFRRQGRGPQLLQGHRVDVAALELVEWTPGDGSGTDGYALESYFDAEGRYLGPDAHGIAPIVRWRR
jgi:hypothetical protein